MSPPSPQEVIDLARVRAWNALWRRLLAPIPNDDEEPDDKGDVSEGATEELVA
jgi:hypothetical protein